MSQIHLSQDSRVERALLVRLAIPSNSKQKSAHGSAFEADEVSEFAALARSAGAEVVGTIRGARRVPDSRLFVGSGKAEEIRVAAANVGATVVLVDHPLSPSQERNLETVLQCRVLDRTGLILDIFAQRARTFEGKLQVELAQLQHLATRLVRGWTHLERQKGGIGLRGPGETQLETDRRLLDKRIQTLNARLKRVLTQRETTRSERKRAAIPTVALVGYTNAGKSTLFNRLTGATTFAADQLFATLDPTLRRIELADARHALLADTVGFVRDLPHELVAAFRSTLQEAREATLLLHIVDAADPHRSERIEQVNAVLAEIGAGALPQIEVFNKSDLVKVATQLGDSPLGDSPSAESSAPESESTVAAVPLTVAEEGVIVQRVRVSAHTGEGIDALVAAIGAFLGPQIVHGRITLAPSAGRARARLFAAGAVTGESMLDNGGSELTISMPRLAFERLCRNEGLPAELGVDLPPLSMGNGAHRRNLPLSPQEKLVSPELAFIQSRALRS